LSPSRSGGTGGLVPILTGMGGGAVALAGVYVAVNRFGVRLPLKPFFAVTSAFLYYMAFVFAGQAVAELQESGLVGTTFVSGGPRLPPLGIYPTVESLAAQGALIGLAVLALIWLFGISPVFRKPAAAPAVVSQARTDREVVRSLERIDADLAEARAEVERLKERLSITADGRTGGQADRQTD